MGASEDSGNQAGLSTKEALSRLRTTLDEVIARERSRRRRSDGSVKLAKFCGQSTSAVFLPVVLLGIVVAVAIFVASTICSSTANGPLLVASCLLIALVVLNCVILRIEHAQRDTEVLRKAECVSRRLSAWAEHTTCEQFAQPDVYGATSESVQVQWTVRDGRVVAVPWPLLVAGDVVALRPGRPVPCRCRALRSDVELAAGQCYLTADSKHAENGFARPIAPLDCVLLEAPAADFLQQCLSSARRPRSVFANEQRRCAVLVFGRLVPTFAAAAVLVAVLRLAATPLSDAFCAGLLYVTSVLLPLCFVVLPLYLFGVNAWNVALVRCMSVTTVPPVDGVSKFADANPPTTVVDCLRGMRRLATGDADSLPRTANLIEALANVSVVCVVDKKGILSWANPTPEKIFFLRTAEASDAAVVPQARRDAELVPQLLDLTHDPQHAFRVDFDNPRWTRYYANLKPLAVNILQNSCSFDAEYTKFIDHVTVVSESVPRTIAVVNRRCCCHLAQVVGFEEAAAPVDRACCTFGAYKKAPGAPPPRGLTKHRTPLCSLFASVRWRDGDAHAQLMSQGTADLVLECCSHAWTGESVAPLGRSARRRVLDYYQRNSMTSYCVALSYRPVSVALAASVADRLVDWPLTSADRPRRLTPADRRSSLDSLLADRFWAKQHVDSAECCVKETLSDHTFLGMIALQYQAKSDVVRMIEQLEKACIRFVHFSKENELRSRVFAEKLGLEAGWNCHIALAEESHSDLLSISPSHSKPNTAHRERHDSLPANTKFSIKTTDGGGADVRRAKADWHQVVSAADLEAPLADADDDDALSMATLSGGECAPLVSRASSVASSVWPDDSPNPLAWPNSSQLPIGVENVRPHLENVDNVPLLVSLFTDCDHSSTRHMIQVTRPLSSAEGARLQIMQQYGEVVACIGSSLNMLNGACFAQADVAVAVEPLLPASCVRRPVGRTRGGGAVEMANRLLSLSCSLLVNADEQLNLVPLIAVCRHRLEATRSSLLFMLGSHLTLSAVQLLSFALLMPPVFTVPQLVLTTCVLVPFVGASLCAAPAHVRASLKRAMPKNEQLLGRRQLKQYAIWTAIRYAPTVAFALCLFAATLVRLCARVDGRCEPSGGARLWLMTAFRETRSLRVARHFVACWLLAYLLCASAAFVHLRDTCRRANPARNVCWLLTLVGALATQVGVSSWRLASSQQSDLSMIHVDWWLWLGALLWLIPAFLCSELSKYLQCRAFWRNQRRQKLSFGTKLGMNSPFA